MTLNRSQYLIFQPKKHTCTCGFPTLYYPTDWLLWMLGGSNIKEILYGKKSEKMGNLMAAVSVSISEM